ncbi:DUF3027 domain-containing protein [Agromyces protaetiae]|uniref:DUF3027 domain-containing protein n=1 Tax=Agromyces protaetiae TaxID=2509455 RepID=A0A4V0YH34_9MICO|nr:DUF3027 domain-containing protein [Agromyces protaetiae]QAY73321.1 DUF3027 domain-containing protein [Agromyces protaetiae]
MPEIEGVAPELEGVESETSVDLEDVTEVEAETPAEPFVADEVLLASAALAQRALLEVTPPETVGSVIGHIAEGEHVLTLLFAADLAGYRGWHWSVTIARVEDAEPTVLETELMPGDEALLAPEWVPWSERLAEYRAAQQAAAAAAAAAGEEFGEDALDDEALADEADDDADDDAEFDDEDDDAETEGDDVESDDDDEDDGFEDHDAFDAAPGEPGFDTGEVDEFGDGAYDAVGVDAFDGIDIDALDEVGDDESDDGSDDDEDHTESDG